MIGPRDGISGHIGTRPTRHFCTYWLSDPSKGHFGTSFNNLFSCIVL